MTYRERREQRVEKLREWADKREAKATAEYDASHAATAMIPFGQPILVGHHSEKRHRNAIARSDRAMRASFENASKAAEMQSKAANIEAAADDAIYSDDPDAIERLTEKIAGLEAERDRRKAINAQFRKDHKTELKAMTAYERHQAMPYPTYSLANISGNLRRNRARLAQLKRTAEIGPLDRMITARFDSTCADCGAALTKGQTIRYNRQAGARCLNCEDS
jgi:DNA repair exonuclease SbcCD ATPase subunit